MVKITQLVILTYGITINKTYKNAKKRVRKKMITTKRVDVRKKNQNIMLYPKVKLNKVTMCMCCMFTL